MYSRFSSPKVAADIGITILSSLYGEEMADLQKPYSISLINDEVWEIRGCITYKDFYIMIQSSDYRVLSIGGYSYMDYITGAGIYSKEKIDMANFGIHSSTIDKCSIPTLKRNGLQDGGTYGLVDNLTYTYNGNQLTKISDSVEDPTYVGAFNFKDGADNSTEYTYDAVGNMTSDKNKGITSITYNVINQPQKITFSDGKTTEYVYSYDGTKLQTIHKTQQPQTSNTTTYCGNLIYENGALKQMLVDGGYVTFSVATPVYHFYIQDHLGNNRVVAKADGTVEQINHYYPYGGLMADICTGSDVQPYKYNGKELDRMHGLDTYDYGARQHNAATGRWHSIDPLCEKYYNVSPYVYCLNNPISFMDFNGCAPDSLDAALMSSLAYEPNEKYQQLLKEKGWTLFHSYHSQSGFKSSLFKKNKDNGNYEYCMAFAGTDTNNFSDIAKDAITDFFNFAGVPTFQYIEAISSAFATYQESELTFTGHSLGGGLATVASIMTGKDAITFNPASISGVLKFIGNIGSLINKGKITQYRSAGPLPFTGDPVNTIQDFLGKPSSGKIHRVNTGKYFSHGIDQIINTFLYKH